MDKLSFELVEHIASYLDAGSAVALSKVCTSTREACLSRLSPERYLQSTFRHGKSLLAAMTDTGCILSGSRALEFFVPGSIEDDAESPSDWDFLVPCKKSSAIGMMDALEKCGVQWDQPFESFAELLNKPVGTVVLVPTAGVLRNPPESFKKGPHPFDSKEAMRLYRRLYDWVKTETIEQNTHVAVKVTPPREAGGRNGMRFTEVFQDTSDDYNDYHAQAYAHGIVARPVCLINGFVQVGKKHVKVQLFQCHLDSFEACTPLEYIAATYYASHVQCFIGGWCAGHFFFDLARDKLALLWPMLFPAQHKAVAKCVRKYNRRGYRFLASQDYGKRFAEGYETLYTVDTDVDDLQLAKDVAVRTKDSCHLGQAGTLLLHYSRIQQQMADFHPPRSTLHYGTKRFYGYMTSSITRLQVSRNRGRPAIVEPVIQDMRRWLERGKGKEEAHGLAIALLLAKKAPDGTSGVRREITGHVDCHSPEWERLDRYLRQSQLACVMERCCETVKMYGPPQI